MRTVRSNPKTASLRGLSYLLAALAFGPAAIAGSTPGQVSLAIYKDAACATKPAGTLEIDITKPCSNYSYVDSVGKTIRGSNGNFRCYPDKLVYDKYPFATDCDPKAKIIDKDHALSGGTQGCLRAPSHEGDVYERLLDYSYPGSETCKPVK